MISRLATGETGLQGRTDDIVEQECTVNEASKTDNLKPFERFPAQPQRDEPDEQSAAGINGATGCGGDGARYRETEEVESTGEGVSTPSGDLDEE